MADIKFEDISFEEIDGRIKANFLRVFSFFIKKDELENIAPFKINGNSISFEGMPEAKARKKLMFLLEKGFKSLKNELTGKPTVYVHRNSGIPLIGNGAFGIVDRGSSIIEVKPITGCNLDCIYCSVAESRRETDFVIEKDYLVDEFRKIAEFKGIEGIEAHINANGEPLLYTPIVELVRDLSSIPGVTSISMDTNATLLSKNIVDELVDAGMTRFNISLNAIDCKLASRIAGKPYNVDNVKKISAYISKKAEIIIAPVWIQGHNDGEMPKIIEFAKSLGSKQDCTILGIQNFLNYKLGRNPVKAIGFDVFYEKLKELEKRHDVSLVVDCSRDFHIQKTRELPKPFRRGEVIAAEIVCPGRFRGEMLAAAKGRTISVPDCSKSGRVKLKITRTKHNIFIGNLL